MSQDVAWMRPVLLQQSREAAGLHIAALAAALKVPVKKLEALEAGRYEELPDLTFARALASSACRHLKIDPGPVLEQIPFGRTPALGDTPNTINAPFKPAQEGATTPAVEWLRRPAVLASLLLVLAAAGLLLAPDWGPTIDQFRQAAPSAAVDASERVEPGPEVSLPPPAAATAETSSDGSQTVVTPTEPATGANPAAAPVPVPAAAAAPADVADAVLLRIQAVGASWVEVVDGKGVSQVQRMLKPGDSLDFSASPPYSVVVGRADAVQVTVRGQSFDVMPLARNSVARFQVK
ncbi:RodZ domain-containing protein [Hydrogenophaga flava]|uniref:RodZ domain-containing protein n=1 Tax=Hydrogenophaga flava TaxID=65657 RepID=UPI00082513B4|nr:RodZ domain-containing protein [Hydrogenophaga flava]